MEKTPHKPKGRPALVAASRRRSLRGPMEKLLRGRWHSYEEQLQNCRRRLTRKRVHQLRLEIRGLLICLKMAEALTANDSLPKKARRILKRKQKALGALRDAQGQLRRVRQELAGCPALRPIYNRLRRCKRQLAKSARKKLKKKNGKLAAVLRGAVQHIGRTLGQNGPRHQAALHRQVQQAGEEALKLQPLSDADSATMHRARIAFKKYLDMTQVFQSLLPRMDAKRLENMRHCQSLMGDIHDLDVFMQRLDKFVAKRKKLAERIQVFRSVLVSRRVELLMAYYELADRLFPAQPVSFAVNGARHLSPFHSNRIL